MRTIVYVAVRLLAFALFVGIMWGLRTFLYAMGQDFAVGFALGGVSTLALLWLHGKMNGKDIFREP